MKKKCFLLQVPLKTLFDAGDPDVVVLCLASVSPSLAANK